MSRARTWPALAATLLASALFGAGAGGAQAAASDPLFVFTPTPAFSIPVLPPPFGIFEGPCGMGVDSAGDFYVSDYYHDAVDVYEPNANYASKQATGETGYLGQLAEVDAVDGPCALAIDAAGKIYVNDYHRAVIRYAPIPLGTKTTTVGAGTTISGATAPDETRPTGVAVDPASGDAYVDERTVVGVYDPSGALVGEIGKNDLEDGYGIAFSSYPGTAGYLYVPDAATNTVKVYDPATSIQSPVQEIDGSSTPKGEFVSLRDASVAVDRVTGEIYVTDNLQPQYTERPQAIAYVFTAAGAYEGHLKFLVTSPLPVGLAVDNSATPAQGRVYLTSGNTSFAAIYAYGPGAATTAPIKLPTAALSLAATGSGAGVLRTSRGDSACASSCEEEVAAGSRVSIDAQADPGSAFSGWSGACAGVAPTCEVTLEESAAVRASFVRTASEDGGAAASGEGGVLSPLAHPSPAAGVVRARHRYAKHRYRKHRHQQRHRARGHHRR
jgi:DNA-binding beta-propeller fold protein YncE